MNQKTGISRRRFIDGAAAGSLAVAAAAPMRLHAQTKWRLRYISFAGKSSIWSQPYAELAKQVEQRSGGELQIDWVGGPEVVGAFQAAEAISKGVFDIAHSAGSYYADAVPEAISMSSGRASQSALYASGVVDFLDQIHQKKLGVKVLSMATSGVGFIFLWREQPKDLSSFKGKKFRSIPIFDPVLRALGATGVTVAPSEVYTALERGVVDGIGWPEITIKEYGYHERAKFLMRPAFFASRTPHLINLRAYERLPKQLQTVLRESARAAGEVADKAFRGIAEAELAAMKEKGLVESPLSPQDAKAFIQLTEDTLWSRIAQIAPDNAPRLRELYSKAESMS